MPFKDIKLIVLSCSTGIQNYLERIQISNPNRKNLRDAKCLLYRQTNKITTLTERRHITSRTTDNYFLILLA